MILYIKHYEQLCNRIWAFLPSLAYALHYNKKIWMFWAFKPYMDLFPNLRCCPNVRSYCEKREFQYRRLFYRLWKFYDKYLMQKKSYRKISNKIPIIFSSGWDGREDPSFIIEEKERIIELFRPQQKIIDLVSSKIDKSSGICYVGVHVRRGDYENFFDGRFYYDIPYYYYLMDKLYKLLKVNYEKIKFVICSNCDFNMVSLDLLSDVSFTKNDLIRFEHANGITDLYALSRCDYIMGPPSTFSQWASFYGGGKLRFIKSKDVVELDLSDFETVKLYTSPFKEFRKYWNVK